MADRDGVRLYVRYYVLRWFHAEVYHILELSCDKQVEAFQAKAVLLVPGFQRERLLSLHAIFLFFFMFYFPDSLIGKNSCVYLPRLPCNEVKLFCD